MGARELATADVSPLNSRRDVISITGGFNHREGDDNKTKKRKISFCSPPGAVGAGAGWCAGTTGGAMVGAAVGSVVPVVGTAIGGAVGGIVGGIGGAIGGYFCGEKAGEAAVDSVDGWFPR